MKDLGFALVVPSRFSALSASLAFSSNQFECFVASLLTSILADRSASYFVVPSQPVLDFWSVVDDFKTAPVVFLRLTMRPSSPSSSEPDEEPEDEGGGGATLRVPFAGRFLNTAIGPSIAK